MFKSVAVSMLIVGAVAVSSASADVLNEITHTGSSNPQTEGWLAIDIVASTSVQFNYLARSGVGPVDDNGIDAWQINDPNGNTAQAQTSAYWATGLPGGNALLTNYWRFSAKLRALPSDGSANAPLNAAMRVWAFSHTIVGSVTAGRNWLVTLENVANGGTRLRMTGTEGDAVDLMLSDDYHWVDLIYSPLLGAADLYVDGALVQTNAAWNGNSPGVNRVEFGDLIFSNSGVGGANWNYADFAYDDQPLAPVGVPEPAAFSLLALGGLAVLRRRR